MGNQFFRGFEITGSRRLRCVKFFVKRRENETDKDGDSKKKGCSDNMAGRPDNADGEDEEEEEEEQGGDDDDKCNEQETEEEGENESGRNLDPR